MWLGNNLDLNFGKAAEHPKNLGLNLFKESIDTYEGILEAVCLMSHIILLPPLQEVNPKSLLAKAVLTKLRQTLNEDRFDVCPVSDFLGNYTTPTEAQFLRAVHCVKWRAIETELLTEIARILAKIVNSL